MRFKRIIVLFLSLVFLINIASLFSSAITADQDQPKATYIRSVDAIINVGALSTRVEGTIRADSSITSIKITLELQKKSGATYSTIKIWEETFSGHSASKVESKLTSPLSNYRLKATFTVYTSSSSETKTMYAYDS